MEIDELLGSANGTNEAGQDVSQFEAPDVGQQEYAEHLSNLVAAALEGTGLFEVIEVKAAAGQAHIMGRVKQENEHKFVHKILYNVLTKAQDTCEIFAGKQFILKNNAVKYGWVFSFGSNDLKEATRVICDAISENVPKREVLDVPMPGANPELQEGTLATGLGKGRKGASLIRG